MIVLVTGGSGCGKSTVTSIFAAHGVPLADADQMSRETVSYTHLTLPTT